MSPSPRPSPIKGEGEERRTELNWGRACKAHDDVEGARAHLTWAAEIFEALGTERYLAWTREDLDKLEASSVRWRHTDSV